MFAKIQVKNLKTQEGRGGDFYNRDGAHLNLHKGFYQRPQKEVFRVLNKSLELKKRTFRIYGVLLRVDNKSKFRDYRSMSEKNAF